MGKNNLMVDGVIKPLKELDYDDLVWLYSDYIDKHGKVPTTNECTIKNNLPHGRIINKILTSSNITYNDFLNQFGKVSHVRTESKDYNLFLNKYKQISNKVGHGLTISELKNNSYGLPSAGWFVKNCPDPSVKTFNEFVLWCGYKSNELKKDKQEVINILIDLEKKLGRPIVRYDIKEETVGFSMIVINRIWGNLGNCKKELGLAKTLPFQPKPFIYYKDILDNFIDHVNVNKKGFTTWKEIENYTNIDHKTFIKTFKDNGNDIYKYLALNNINLNPNGYGYTTILSSGEKITSSYEYDFSMFLEANGFYYNEDYKRDVLYRNYLPLDKKSRINCDYVFYNKYFIEIAGIISNKDRDWDTHKYAHKVNIKYQNKMLKKKKILEEYDIDYLFLFPEDFYDQTYKEKFFNLIKRK